MREKLHTTSATGWASGSAATTKLTPEAGKRYTEDKGEHLKVQSRNDDNRNGHLSNGSHEFPDGTSPPAPPAQGIKIKPGHGRSRGSPAGCESKYPCAMEMATEDSERMASKNLKGS